MLVMRFADFNAPISLFYIFGRKINDSYYYYYSMRNAVVGLLSLCCVVYFHQDVNAPPMDNRCSNDCSQAQLRTAERPLSMDSQRTVIVVEYSFQLPYLISLLRMVRPSLTLVQFYNLMFS